MDWQAVAGALAEQIERLLAEIARLKGLSPRPKLGPSALTKPEAPAADTPGGKRPGSTKRSKLGTAEIHETKLCQATQMPKGSRFKGYVEYTVWGLRFEAHNTLYRREKWQLPNGKIVVAPLPEGVTGHMSDKLRAFIVHQHVRGLVPQAVIVEMLRDVGVEISEGQVQNILATVGQSLGAEKERLLQVGLEISKYIHVDDTGARHRGKNGVCTHIGNKLFAYFASKERKSRINFLELLRAGRTTYQLNVHAFAYMKSNALPDAVLQKLQAVGDDLLTDADAWKNKLAALDITSPRHIRIATEGALLASAQIGMHPELAIMSDDAGQFNVLFHVLCWVHAERNLAKLIGSTDEQRVALEQKRGEVWALYRSLKAYKIAPSAAQYIRITAQFAEITTAKTCFASLNLALGRIGKNKEELLAVLDRPELPLHNNLSEGDIRGYVIQRKRNGGTRSDAGRQCRDTFASIAKTCRKLGVSFFVFLIDRMANTGIIASLDILMRQRATVPS